MQTPSVSIDSHYRICPLCEACCGLEISVQENKIIRIRGYEDDVLSEGYICPKGLALKDLHEDPDRLRQPMIKRDGIFVKATWNEAFEEIARRLPTIQSSYGQNAVGVVAGNPTTHKMGLMLYLPRLLRALKTKQFFSAATLDQIPRHVVSALLYGQWMTIPIPDIARSQWLMVIGANPVVSNGSMWTVPDFRGKAKALQARGGKLIVIDPRRTETAVIADEHHFIAPSGDVFFLLGMLHTLFEEGLIQLGQLHDLVDGLTELREVVKPYAPELMSQHCGIDSPTIRRLACELAHEPQAAIYGRIGVNVQQFGTLNTWLIDLLNILTGHMDVAGGTMFAKAAAFAVNTIPTKEVGKGREVGLHRYQSRVSQAPEVMGEYPIGCLAEEITTSGEGQIHALITIATNPVLSSPNGQQLSAALKQLDFMVSVDIYINETTQYADVILPGLSPLEVSHFDIPYPQMAWRNTARYSAPIFAHQSEQLSEWEILLRLANIANIAKAQADTADIRALDDAAFCEEAQRTLGPYAEPAIAVTQHLVGPERLLDVALRGGPYGAGFSALNPDQGLHLAAVQNIRGGIDLGALQPRLPKALRTHNGRINLAPQLLLDDLNRVVAVINGKADTPSVQAPSPDVLNLRIIGRRDIRSNNSWMHNLPLLQKGADRCTAFMHPQDAANLAVETGDRIAIESALHRIQVKVEVTNSIMPGLICLPHGWGHDQAGTQLEIAEQHPGVNLNSLLSETLRDPISGNAELNGAVVSVSRADSYQ